MTIRWVAPVASVALAVLLAGCGGQDKPAADTSAASVSDSTSAVSASTSASASASAPVSTSPTAASTAASASAMETTGPAAAPAEGEKPPREFVVGKWGTDGDCELAIDLRADGTTDGPFGNWTYNDGVIGFADEPDFKVNVTVVDDSTMKSTSDGSGKTMTMTRCP